MRVPEVDPSACSPKPLSLRRVARLLSNFGGRRALLLQSFLRPWPAAYPQLPCSEPSGRGTGWRCLAGRGAGWSFAVYFTDMHRSFRIAASLMLPLVLWASVARADPLIYRVGEDSPQRTRELQAMMRRYRFTAVTSTRAPDFYASDVAGGSTGLPSFRSEWLVLVFFATWCGPCMREMPSLDEFSRAAVGTGHVLAVATDSPEAAVAPYVRRLGLSFTVLYDAGGRVARAYSVVAYPTIFILEPGGKIVGTVRGSMDWHRLLPMLEDMRRMTR
jgi:peroxiredoxin